MAVSQAKVFALVPSHPPGYTAGKWREWYPDVVARAGNTGVVTNPLLGELEGQLSVEAEKFLWQRGWWLQHQRLLASLAQRSGLRFVLSGDIHAQGAVAIERSGENDFSSDPLVSVLVGPVSTSTGSWPSPYQAWRSQLVKVASIWPRNITPMPRKLLKVSRCTTPSPVSAAVKLK